MYPTNCNEVSPSELEARLRLHRLPELGPKRFRVLMEAFGCASKALSARPVRGAPWGCRPSVPTPDAALKFVMAPVLHWRGWSVRPSIC